MVADLRVTTGELVRWLQEPLREILSPFGATDLTPLSESELADGTSVLLVRDSRRRRRAVVLVSAPAAPNMVDRAMERARLAKAALGEPIGRHILDPLGEGAVKGLTFAVLPYCRPLSESRPLWWLQRARLRPVVLEWLWEATRRTVRDVAPEAIEPAFLAPLRRLASLPQVGGAVRERADAAIQDLGSGAWTPKTVLMHGDMWKGNILVRGDSGRRWPEGFVVIDWAGSDVSGHGMYDLVRLSRSLTLSPSALRAEVLRHCDTLGCEPAHAPHHLLVALGHVLTHLEHFPVERYLRVVDACISTLEQAFPSGGSASPC
jgi:hypothetical protein